MKFFTTCFLVFLTAFQAFSQTSNAVVFSENREKFTLILNGEKKNDKPAANVKVNGLTGEFYQARVDFEDASLPDFSSNNFAVKPGLEVTYMVKLNKKGEYVLRYAGEAPASAAPQATTAPEPAVKQYAIADDAPAENSPNGAIRSSGSAGSPGESVNQNVTMSQTTTTTTRPVTSRENVTMNMNMGGVNMGVNMNVTGMDAMEMEESQSTITTTTTTAQTSSASPPSQPLRGAERETIVTSTSGCGRAMDSASFERAKKSIADKGFDESRLTMAKQVAKGNCMTSAMIKGILGTFSFEETKLDFARFAYDYCYDPGNYYEINDAFTFESSIEELNEYLNSK
jgi:hypothetical protein